MKSILLQNLHWKGYGSPITTQYWAIISKGSQAVKFSHVLDFVDGMLCQDQSFIAKYILSITGEVTFPQSARSVSSLTKITWTSFFSLLFCNPSKLICKFSVLICCSILLTSLKSSSCNTLLVQIVGSMRVFLQIEHMSCLLST